MDAVQIHHIAKAYLLLGATLMAVAFMGWCYISFQETSKYPWGNVLQMFLMASFFYVSDRVFEKFQWYFTGRVFYALYFLVVIVYGFEMVLRQALEDQDFHFSLLFNAV